MTRNVRRNRRSIPIRFLRWLFYKPNQSFTVIVLIVVALVMGYRWFDREYPGVLVFGSDVNNFVPAAGASSWIAGQASVIDGDTIEIHGQRIRLYGIDAPESDQTCERGGNSWRCGQTAALELSGFIGTQTVKCVEKDRDRYGRIVAKCEAKGIDVGQWMVEQGLALAYRRYSIAYIANEDRAKGTRRGMWAGQFQPPWEYRASKR